MKFYFCEKCGKRVTEQDIEAGKARDKRLKGVYCDGCAVGVMTMELAPITKEEAHKLLAPQEHKSNADLGAHPRPGGPTGQLAKRGVAAEPPKANQNAWLYALAAIAVAGLALGATLMRRAPKETEVRKTAPATIAAPPIPSVPHPEIQAKPDLPSTAGNVPDSSPEYRAQAAFEKLNRFEGLAAEDRAGRIERIEAYLREYGEAIVAARARGMLQELRTPPVAGQSASSPGAGPTPPVPKPPEGAPIASSPNSPEQTPAPGNATALAGEGPLRLLSPSLTQGLVAHWKLDGGSKTQALDSVGTGNAGTLHNGPVWVGGKIGGGLQFDGVDDYLMADVAGIDSVEGGKNTVAFWMKWFGGENQVPFSFGGAYNFWLQSGFVGINSGEQNLIGAPSAGLKDRWVHVAIVLPNAPPAAPAYKLYLNGILQAVRQHLGTTTKNGSATRKIYLGGFDFVGGLSFSGVLDDVRIYNRELTKEEVAALGNVEVLAPPQPETPIDRLLGTALRVLAKGNPEEALAMARSNQEVLDAQRDALAAAVESLKRSQAEQLDALRKRIGQVLQLETAKEVMVGRLVEVNQTRLKMSGDIVVRGVVQGTREWTVLLDDLKDSCRRSLFNAPEPITPDAWVAQALSRFAAGDSAQAEAVLAHVPAEHPLVAPLRRLAHARKDAERQQEAERAWSALEARAKSATTSAQSRDLLKELTRLEERFAETAWASDPAKMAARAAWKEQMERQVLGLDPRLLKAFKGKVTAWDPATLLISLSYDFSVKEQLDDFPGSTSKDAVGNSGISWKKNELLIQYGNLVSQHLVAPQFAANEFSAVLHYKIGGAGKKGFGICLFGPASAGVSEKLCLFTNAKETQLQPISAINNGSTVIYAKAENPIVIPMEGQFKFEAKGRRVALAINGNQIFKHELEKENDHQGFSIGGGSETLFTLSGLQISARLDKRWIDTILNPK